MSVYRKVKAVERLFTRLEKEVNEFQDKSGLKCLAGCGFCCTKPDIQVTVLEFIPLAYYLYKCDKAEEMHQQLSSSETSSVCLNFKVRVPGLHNGFCSNYNYRGLICRLFGFSAAIQKNGNPVLAACAPVKTEKQDDYFRAVEMVNKGTHLPIMSSYYMLLRNIDYSLSDRLYPINIAIGKALEYILTYYSYRGKRA